ncbi:hypothetical protein Q5H93_03425 [Hymenobacter sp. ASUV-10]|uniref:C2H2-type domain-containing protein n=1 Tax=Hymenobacter aranciens TaxID=3063996 RepID=A0ABT9B670_9BACT|nr:hypothetical protein [Hymenobacter sp. ASUV-10]MDO7873769.1 hypothetical protein [Hymenobacter sp. ASUV-10]
MRFLYLLLLLSLGLLAPAVAQAGTRPPLGYSPARFTGGTRPLGEAIVGQPNQRPRGNAFSGSCQARAACRRCPRHTNLQNTHARRHFRGPRFYYPLLVR